MLDTITHTYLVPGISCAHCVAAITQEVSAVDGVESVAVDVDSKVVTVVGGSDPAVVAAIGEAGYEVER
jgi:copper chaperone CopZ